jgi:hypothetical protein
VAGFKSVDPLHAAYFDEKIEGKVLQCVAAPLSRAS